MSARVCGIISGDCFGNRRMSRGHVTGAVKGEEKSMSMAIYKMGSALLAFAFAAALPSRADIVIAPDADKAARFAAVELKHHLNAITGGSIEIVVAPKGKRGDILVGLGPHTGLSRADFKPQEWLVDVADERIVLAGRDAVDKGGFTLDYDGEDGVRGKNWPRPYDEQGTMYAVYDFLENECGVVWADAEDGGTFIPRRESLSFSPTRRRREPFIRFRGLSDGPSSLDNSFWVTTRSRIEEYRRLAFALPKNRESQNRIFLVRHRVGGENYYANHSFYHYYKEFWQTNSPRFVARRPELFAKGYPDGELPPQMCYSSREFFEQVVKDIRAYFDQDPKTGKFQWGRDNYCLEGMDNDSYCLCDECRSQYEPARLGGRTSAYCFGFVKRVAEEIAKSHPGKTISTLAYQSHEAPPVGVDLPKNVLVYFCLYANRLPYAKICSDQLERIREWRAAYPEHSLALWLYNCFPAANAERAGFNCFPAFVANDAFAQYQLFKEQNVRAGMFQCGLNGAADTFMQLSWMVDPDLSPEILLNRYFSTYGRPGRHLKEFYRLVETRYADRSLYPEGGVMHQSAYLAWGRLGTKDLMDRLASEMGKAEAAAETPGEKRRLAVWRYAVWDFMKEGYDAYQKRASAAKPAWTARRIADASGDVANVDWNALPSSPLAFYNANSADKTHFTGSIRLAHDGKWLYLELAQDCDTEKLVISPGIICYDVWECYFAGQEALPFRQYFSGPDGRMQGRSHGEVNWRMGVLATESGPEAFGARCVSDRSAPGRWTQRFAFPLDNLIERALTPGDVLYANFVRVVSPGLLRKGENYVQPVVSHSTVKTTDRLARITLEK